MKRLFIVILSLSLVGCAPIIDTPDPQADVINPQPQYWSLDRDTMTFCFALNHSDELECYRLIPLEKRNQVVPTEK